MPAPQLEWRRAISTGDAVFEASAKWLMPEILLRRVAAGRRLSIKTVFHLPRDYATAAKKF
jgi:hypothetical protein